MLTQRERLSFAIHHSSLEISGRQWSICFSTLPAFAGSIDTGRSLLILISGLFIALLAFAVIRSLSTSLVAGKALREHEERFYAVIENSHDLIAMMDGVGIIRYVSPSIEAMLGYRPADLVGRNFLEFMHPDDLSSSSHRFGEIFQHPAQSLQHEARMGHKDGSWRILDITAKNLLDNPAVAGIVINSRDITERKRAEEALRQAYADLEQRVQERTADLRNANAALVREIAERKRAEEALLNHLNLMETLLDTIPIPIFYKNTKGIYLGCNQALSDFLGLPKNEIIGKSVYDIYPKEQADKYFEMDTALFQQPGVQIYDFSMGHADGTLRDVNFNKATYSSVDGTLAGLVGVMVDITERKRTEIERLHFSKLDSLSTLAGGIAHDFNNILTAILGNISLAILNGQIEPKVRDRLSQAEQACLRAQSLSQQLLTFARGGAPIKKISSIPELLKESAGLILSGSNVRCEFSIPEDLWPVEADAGQISQVFGNLLINADQAMPEGGIIKIRAENVLVAEKSGLPLSAGKYLRLTFSDQGVGIPANILNKIFDPYFSTKQKGSGLGLATAHSIIQNHSGIIKVESQTGIGTTFTVYLPATEAGALADESELLEPVRGGGMVLVMDDEDMVREVLDRMLGHLGYEADFASDGSQAIEKFAEAKEAGRPFVAVILDLTIPGGMGGKETMEKLLKIDPQVKAMVSSGYSDDPIMANFEKYGFSAVIAKPYRFAALSKVLQGVITKRAN